MNYFSRINHLLRDHSDHTLKNSDAGLILKPLSLLDKHSEEFFDVYYTMIIHNIKHYFLMTLHNRHQCYEDIFQAFKLSFSDNVSYL